MNILYLPGQGKHNEAEWKSVTDTLEIAGRKVIKHRWRAWDNDSEKWNTGYELEKIDLEIGQTFGIEPHFLTATLTQERGEFTIVAKSIGTLLSLDLIQKYDDQIDKVIFMGLPLQNWEQDSKNDRLEKYKKILSKTKLKITIIQNTNDPLGSFEFISNELGEFKNIELIEIEASDHRYDYSELIFDLLNK